MRKIVFLIATVLFFSSGMMSQSASVPVSTYGKNDQLLQGPCGLFAAYAALESKALQTGIPCLNEGNIDFYEWMGWSYCALDCAPGSDIMIELLFEYARDYGVDNDNGYWQPATSTVPNSGDPTAKGIAWFTGDQCTVGNDFCHDSYYMKSEEGTCEERYPDSGQLPLKYEFIEADGRKFRLTETNGELMESHPSPSKQAVIDWLNEGYGVIAGFNNWNGSGIGHVVYIYGYNSTLDKFSYRDSWPGHAGNYSNALSNLTDLNAMYRLVASIYEVGATNVCQKTINGPSTVKTSSEVFYISDPSNDICTVDWSVSGNLMIVSSSKLSVTVKRKDCGLNFGTVNAFVNGECNLSSRRVFVQTRPGQPITSPSGYPTFQMQLGSMMPISVISAPGADPHSLSWVVNGSIELVSTYANNCTVEATSFGVGNFYVRSSNACGVSPAGGGAVNVSNDGSGLPVEKSNISNLVKTENDFLKGKSLAVFPNPIKNQATIVYKIYSDPEVNISLYDFLGRKLKILINESKEKGTYQISLNRENLSSGIYYIKLSTKEKTVTEKIILQ